MKSWRGWASVAASGIGAILLVIAVLTKSWLSNEPQGIYIGPRGATSCPIERVHIQIDDNARPIKLHIGDRESCSTVSMSNSELTDGLERAILGWRNASLGKEPRSAREADLFDRLDGLVSGKFGPLGWITIIVSLLLAVGLLVGAAAPHVLRTKTGRPMKLKFLTGKTMIAALIVDLLFGGGFLVARPGPPGFVAATGGAYVFVIGIVLGIVGAALAETE